MAGNIEALKTQRDLYFAFRDLFIRHDSMLFLTVTVKADHAYQNYRKIQSIHYGKRWKLEQRKLNRYVQLKRQDGKLKLIS